MNEIFIFLLLILLTAHAKNPPSHHEFCQSRVLSHPTIPTRLNIDVERLVEHVNKKLGEKLENFSIVSRDILQHSGILGVAFTTKGHHLLGLNVSKRLKIFPNRTTETELFWNALNGTKSGWGRAFKDCDFLHTWVYSYVTSSLESTVGIFVQIVLNQCDEELAEIFNGTHNCHQESTECVKEEPALEKRGNYRCICRKGFYRHNVISNLSWSVVEDTEMEGIDMIRCLRCPDDCEFCDPLTGICPARQDVYLKTAILCIQLVCMAVTVLLALIVFKQRKTKAIASGMWKILETILVGVFILYSTAVVKSFEPSVVQCLLDPWFREVGFIICYGAIILKLYRHLIEFRTRKAHRWVVKDTDLLKYLLIMTMSVLAYMAAYTSITLNFIQENYSLLYLDRTLDGERYYACKSLWWDYVTETGELVILIFGIHLSYASRNARTQFHVSL